MADKGGNLNANETARRFFARPLTDAEVNDSRPADVAYNKGLNQSQSTYQRYLAVNNPDSFLTRMGMMASAHLNVRAFSDLLKQAGKLFSLQALGSLLSSVNPPAQAAGSHNDQDYGIVQWGWSNQEEDLIKNAATYAPLENQRIIESATYGGQPAVDAIASKYNVCWGYDASGGIDNEATMGKLLSDKDIQRDATGDVVADKGLCSPTTLGVNSNDADAYDPTTGKNDLIFRYRLERNLEKILDQEDSIQNANPNPAQAH